MIRHTPSHLLAATLALAAAACGDNGETYAETTQLLRYASCEDLRQDLAGRRLAEVSAAIDNTGRYWGRGIPEVANDSAPAPTASGSKSGSTRSYSKTNTQEAEVDEADLVKTDGNYIYTVSAKKLHIFAVADNGALTATSEFPLEGYGQELLIDGDRAVVFSSITSDDLPTDHPLRNRIGKQRGEFWYWRTSLASKLTVLDLSDRAAPKATRELYLEGWYKSARLYDGMVRLFSYDETGGWVDSWRYLNDAKGAIAEAKARAARELNAAQLDELLPLMYERKGEAIDAFGLSDEDCRSYFAPTDSLAHGIASLMSLDLRAPNAKPEADHIVGSYPTFYASKDYVVIAEAAHGSWWLNQNRIRPEFLNIHRFDLRERTATTYAGSGRVLGSVVNQFALDEHQGLIRIATTTQGRQTDGVVSDAPVSALTSLPPVDPTTSENHLWVLEPNGSQLMLKGHLGGLGKNESIYSVRFTDDMAYVVTFQRIDPLYTIDLRDPAKPTVLGELKMPGFSTYLHPMEGNQLLAIGVGGTETGANWRTTISWFDVAKPEAPAIRHQLPIEAANEWGWSEAAHEHKAFTYYAPHKLLAIPQAGSHYDGRYYRYLSRLELITVDPTTGLSRKGAIDHSSYVGANDYEWGTPDIRRSLFIENNVYTLSSRALTSHRVDNLQLVSMQPLPGPEYRWGW